MASLRALSFLIYLVSTVYCGEITVVHGPSTLRFGSADTLRASNLGGVLTSALGYTPKESSTTWNGLTIESPFSLPVAAVVLEVHGGGATFRQEGSTYSLKEDTPMIEVYKEVKAIVGSRAQRETFFVNRVVDDDLVENSSPHDPIPSTKVLNITVEPDATFLREMASFIKQAMKVNEKSTTKQGGQDVIFMELNALAHLVKTYGVNSEKVEEAISVLRNHLGRVTDILRQAYGDRVLVITATVDQVEEHSRPSRSILQTKPDRDINLATEYSSDYPVVFNIILWVSLIMILFVAFAAISMAFMDPGKDSIIYRMTNPRMKKDN